MFCQIIYNTYMFWEIVFLGSVWLLWVIVPRPCCECSATLEIVLPELNILILELNRPDQPDINLGRGTNTPNSVSHTPQEHKKFEVEVFNQIFYNYYSCERVTSLVSDKRFTVWKVPTFKPFR